MIFGRQRDADEIELEQAIREGRRMADLLGYPKEWVVCPACAAHSWRYPPHAMDPCPLVVEHAQAQGLKVDAERGVAVRMGVQLQEATRMFLEHFGAEEEDDSED